MSRKATDAIWRMANGDEITAGSKNLDKAPFLRSMSLLSRKTKRGVLKGAHSMVGGEPVHDALTVAPNV